MTDAKQLDIETLLSLLTYDPETGVLRWKKNMGGKANAGSVAGHIKSTGYCSIGLLCREHPAHRLAWAIHHGEWPAGEVDHINGIRSDNRIQNLRDVSRAVNAQNQRAAHRDNLGGVLGASRFRDRWRSQIWHAGKRVHLGIYATKEEAHAAYVTAKRQLHPGGLL
jgi:hypothetical protein